MSKLTAETELRQELEKTQNILVNILKLSKSIIRNMRKITQITAQITGSMSEPSIIQKTIEEEEITTYTFKPEEREKK